MAVPRRVVCGIVVALSVAVAPAEARQGPPPTLFRIFLTSGQALTSYGEWARLGDRVIFSMPLVGDASELTLLSVPSDEVDWQRTERYADAARASHYAATRGGERFRALHRRSREGAQ